MVVIAWTQIFSTYKGSGYAVDSGTSMAAPYVAGAAAVYKSQFPNASPAQTMATMASITSSVTITTSIPSVIGVLPILHSSFPY
jgi:subtilisin family serine protease